MTFNVVFYANNKKVELMSYDGKNISVYTKAQFVPFDMLLENIPEDWLEEAKNYYYKGSYKQIQHKCATLFGKLWLTSHRKLQVREHLFLPDLLILKEVYDLKYGFHKKLWIHGTVKEVIALIKGANASYEKAIRIRCLLRDILIKGGDGGNLHHRELLPHKGEDLHISGERLIQILVNLENNNSQLWEIFQFPNRANSARLYNISTMWMIDPQKVYRYFRFEYLKYNEISLYEKRNKIGDITDFLKEI